MSCFKLVCNFIFLRILFCASLWLAFILSSMCSYVLLLNKASSIFCFCSLNKFSSSWSLYSIIFFLNHSIQLESLKLLPWWRPHYFSSFQFQPKGNKINNQLATLILLMSISFLLQSSLVSSYFFLRLVKLVEISAFSSRPNYRVICWIIPILQFRH